VGLIDRIRYYDGEFLRAFDFSDEQTYHMEMRRRLNRYLHLYGIVEGLNLAGDSEAGVTQVSIMPGLAIDALGREIYVFVPYTLGDSDITTNRITQGGTYDVWLRYQKTASTPPSSGYSNCNQANQYTRWVESFSVVLLQSPSHPFTYPGFSVDDTDDPSQDKVGVLLGTVVISLTSATGTFSGQLFDPNRCKLLGVIAQRIQTPPCSDTAGVSSSIAPFNFWNQPSGGLNTPLSPPASLEIKPNIFADQNLIVGGDFSLAQTPSGTTITPTPAFTTGPGSAKLAGDLIVQGNIYSFVANPTKPQWLGLSAYVSQLLQSGMPAFVASQPVPVLVPTPAPAATSFSVSGPSAPSIVINSPLTSVSSVAAPSAAISGIQLNAGVSFAAQVGVFITNVTGAPGPGANQCTVTVAYTVTGDFPLGGTPSVLSFYITASAVCFPPSS
jgi:hypothetical protein